MDDKELSGEEKRRLMKEEIKKDLRARKEFLEKVKNLKQLQKINKALSELNPEDDTDEWINKLNQETAFNEAKAELALESSKTVNIPIEGPGEELPVPNEEEMKKIAAEEMVRKMKEEMAEESGKTILGKENAVNDSNEKEEENKENEDRPFRKMMDDVE